MLKHGVLQADESVEEWLSHVEAVKNESAFSSSYLSAWLTEQKSVSFAFSNPFLQPRRHSIPWMDVRSMCVLCMNLYAWNQFWQVRWFAEEYHHERMVEANTACAIGPERNDISFIRLARFSGSRLMCVCMCNMCVYMFCYCLCETWICRWSEEAKIAIYCVFFKQLGLSSLSMPHKWGSIFAE
jgi:hypothetical protein